MNWPTEAPRDLSDWVSNGRGSLTALNAAGVSWPVLVGEPHEAATATWLTSLVSALISTPRDELLCGSKPTVATSSAAFAFDVAQRIALLTGIDRAVMVNNTLLSVSPVGLSQLHALSRAVERAAQNWPDRIVITRGLIADVQSIRAATANLSGFVIPNRVSYVFDYTKPVSHKINATRDFALLRKAELDVVSHDGFRSRDLEAVHAQYTAVYIGRHGVRNPQFTLDYVRHIHHARLATFWGLKRGAELVAFTALRDHGDFWSVPLIGYRTESDKKEGLYRQIFALALSLAEAKKVVINFGAGAGHYKTLRGGVAAIEYMLIIPPRATWLGRSLDVLLRLSEAHLGRMIPQAILAHGG